MLKKRLSQHLIKDRNITDKMVKLAQLKEDDIVVEIGAGHGDLTKSIAEKAGHVYAVEFDKDMIARLKTLAKKYGNITVIQEDFLKTSLLPFSADKNIIIMGNIPYKITGPIIFKLLEDRKIVSAAYLTMQAEVAGRIVSRSHKRTYGAISVVCQILCDVKILFNLQASVFVPPPKIDSAFLRMVPKEEKKNIDQELLGFVRASFQNKRKYLKYALSKTYTEDMIEHIYSFMGLSDTARAEEISPDQFEKMYNFVKGNG
ncbi:MAG TPA: 16S rRNA (adenine(1518)-N(6)/adenine(1519)-N(6))-dimethyltransferase RsmA [Syntrophorhabdus sp.]|nr:16S rRNA (adenine(1518)-N(6)/adenine(1519)-N(6))-dimethyltransferase RsmA [Syntrophorhabdus sp.]HQB33335.1 16S rRNA (adenine(1518)-N(6)/adenine(1519)-N(6))-dimethyltransferase RsmA [Syntrophorhabdus sp.]